MTSDAKRLADAFRSVIVEWLTFSERREVDRRNVEYSHDTCATHDFCDANVAMDAAFQATFGRDFDFDADWIVWFDAWSLAKERGFSRR